MKSVAEGPGIPRFIYRKHALLALVEHYLFRV